MERSSIATITSFVDKVPPELTVVFVGMDVTASWDSDGIAIGYGSPCAEGEDTVASVAEVEEFSTKEGSACLTSNIGDRCGVSHGAR